MRTLAVVGALLVLGSELLALLLRQRQLLLVAAGIAVAFLLLGIRALLAEHGAEPAPDPADADDHGDSLRRWMSSTETLIRWSESSRRDWDRHWRPILARSFASATGQRQGKDPAAFDATGRLLFGAELWQWADPGNVARGGGGSEPGPGRVALEEILQRLEQL